MRCSPPAEGQTLRIVRERPVDFSSQIRLDARIPNALLRSMTVEGDRAIRCRSGEAGDFLPLGAAGQRPRQQVVMRIMNPADWDTYP